MSVTICQLPLLTVKIYKHLEDFISARNAVVTAGTFDGVHLGHQQLIARLKETANRTNGETVLLSFFPHPRMVLNPDNKISLLNTEEEKISLLEKAGIDHLIVHPFNREFSMLSSEEFIKSILVSKLCTKKLIIGYDHHFGRDRLGSFNHLKEFGPVYGFDIEEIPEQEVKNIGVSSTKIRTALQSGNLEIVESFLGYKYEITGIVVKGRQLGRSIDFPTANLLISDALKMIPADGVYAVWVKRRDSVLKGMLNIGMRPTLDGKERTLEVNILDFEGDLYGETLTLYFVNRLRNEIKFDGLDALKVQLGKDREATRNILLD